jgi:hypothetical protein
MTHPNALPPSPNDGVRTPLLQAPATRSEVFLFGLLILALVWTFGGMTPRTVIVVPDTPVRAGVIT